jgi:carotenoid cleavage dioxygenase-like enzyme
MYAKGSLQQQHKNQKKNNMIKRIKALILLFYNLIWLLLYSFIDFVSLRMGFRNPRETIFLKENFAPIYDELTDVILLPRADSHALPSDFPSGIYVRNGPNPQYIATRGDYHWFDGDSMLHGVTVDKNGNMRYRNRYTKTYKYLAEKLHKQAIVYGIKNYLNVFVQLDYWYQKIVKGLQIPTRGTANTSVVFHAGKLFANLEVDKPYHILVPSLDTAGQYDFDGKLKHPVTAHPKIDPDSGEMIMMCYYISEPKLGYSIVDKNGQLVHDVMFEKSPFPTMMHDFACTKNYTIFTFFPLVFEKKNVLYGKSPWEFKSELNTKIAVVPRRYNPETDEIQWFEAKSGWAFHTCNSYEEGDEIIIQSCRSNSISIDFTGNTEQEYQQNYSGALYEYRLNMKTKQVKEQPLMIRAERSNGSTTETLYGDFPVINDLHETKKNRYVWLGRFGKSNIVMNAIVKVDLENLTYREYRFKDTQSGGEWVVVRKQNATAEDDVYVVGFLYDESNELSTFEVIDGKTMNTDKMTIAQLPRRVPYGFHGKYVKSEQY